MICPRCKCEIGNQSRCPYCGTYIKQNAFDNSNATVQIRQNSTQDESTKNHISNIDTWSLINVVLLSGVFITNILQLILQLAD